MVKDYTKRGSRSRSANHSDRKLPREPRHEEHGHASEPLSVDLEADSADGQNIIRIVKKIRRFMIFTGFALIFLSFGFLADDRKELGAPMVIFGFFMLFLSIKLRRFLTPLGKQKIREHATSLGAVLSQHIVSEEVGNRVTELMEQNRKIEAIKYVRQELGLGLKHAKFFVENYVPNQPFEGDK